MRLIISALLVFAAACATSPYSGQPVDTNRIVVAGFAKDPGVRVRVDAYDWSTNTFYMVANATSASTPTLAAGAICPNSPPLYAYNVTTDPLMWPIYWKKNPAGRYEAKVQATQIAGGGTWPLKFTANPNGPSCIQANITPNCDFRTVAQDICGYTLNDAIIVSTKLSPWFD
jgi:hypothetical protein